MVLKGEEESGTRIRELRSPEVEEGRLSVQDTSTKLSTVASAVLPVMV